MTRGEATKSKTQNRETSQGRKTQRNQTNKTNHKTGHAKRTNQKHTEGGATSTSQDKGPQGGQTKPNKTRARGEGDKRRPARKERADAREGSRTGGRKQHKPRRRACAVLAVSEGETGSHEGEYLSDGARAHEQHLYHGGRAPHRAEAFVARERSEDRSQSTTTRHTKGMTTGPLQIQPDIRREGPAEHWLDQKPPGDNQGRGKGGTGKSGPNRKHQATRKSTKRQQPQQNTEQQQQKRRAPQHQEKAATREAHRHRPTENRDNQGKQEMHGREERTHTDHHTNKKAKVIGGMSIPVQCEMLVVLRNRHKKWPSSALPGIRQTHSEMRVTKSFKQLSSLTRKSMVCT